MIARRLMAMMDQSAISWPWRTRKPLLVEHLRYVTRPAIDPLDKALAMAKQLGKPELVAKVEEARGLR